MNNIGVKKGIWLKGFKNIDVWNSYEDQNSRSPFWPIFQRDSLKEGYEKGGTL